MSTQSNRPFGVFLLERTAYHHTFGEELRGELAQRVRLPSEVLDAASWRSYPDLIAQAEVILGGWGMPALDREFLACAKNLKAVFFSGGSVRSIATEEFWATGIPLVSASALNAIPVAEYSLAMIILGLKQIWRFALGAQRTGGAMPRNEAMAGAYRSVVGLVSLGSAGRATAEKLRAILEVKILAYDPFCPTATAAALGIELVSLEEIFARSDVVSIHSPLLPETKGLIRGEHLRSMRPGATLVNTARGAIIRERDLIEVLSVRPDLTAILDVLEQEPLPANSPLAVLPNVILTPHIAGSVGAECRRLGRGMIEELDRFLTGRPLLREVKRDQIARIA